MKQKVNEEYLEIENVLITKSLAIKLNELGIYSVKSGLFKGDLHRFKPIYKITLKNGKELIGQVAEITVNVRTSYFQESFPIEFCFLTSERVEIIIFSEIESIEEI
jgi:hypothetical protein